MLDGFKDINSVIEDQMSDLGEENCLLEEQDCVLSDEDMNPMGPGGASGAGYEMTPIAWPPRCDDDLAHLEKQVSLRPGHLKLRHQLATLYMHSENWIEAARHFEECLKIKSNDREVMALLDSVYSRLEASDHPHYESGYQNVIKSVLGPERPQVKRPTPVPALVS